MLVKEESRCGFHSSMKGCQIYATVVGDLLMMIEIVNYGLRVRAHLK